MEPLIKEDAQFINRFRINHLVFSLRVMELREQGLSEADAKGKAMDDYREGRLNSRLELLGNYVSELLKKAERATYSGIIQDDSVMTLLKQQCESDNEVFDFMYLLESTKPIY